MWWQSVIAVVVVVFGIYAFFVLARSRTKTLERRTNRRAEDLYDDFADRPRRFRRHYR